MNSLIKKQQKKAPELRFSGFDDDLQKTTLGKLAVRIGDGIHTTPSYSDDGEFYFVNGNNLDNGRIIFSDTTKRLNGVEAIKHKRALDTNTLLLSINGTVGNVALYKNELITLGKSACYIKLNENESVDFVYYLIQSSTVQRFYYSEVTGSTIKNLSLKSVANTPVSLPNNDEQQKIADFLSLVDEWLDNIRQQQTALETYKRGMMQKIFTQQIRFNDENDKEFPEWQQKILGSLFKDSGDGGTPSTVKSSYYGGSIKWATIDDIVPLIFETKKKLTEEGLKHSSAKIWPKGSIIISTGATIGEVGIAGVPISTKQGIAGIVVGENFVNNVFLRYWFLKNKSLLLRFAQGGSIKEVRLPTIKKFVIQTPSLPEQVKIADFLTAIDETIKVKSEEITKVEQWKKGLMQKMFV